MPTYYDQLYRLHDTMLSNRQADAAITAERETKRHRLLNQFDDMQELPALSSFLEIQHAMEEDNHDGEEISNAPKTRDGFERMKR